MTKSKARKSSKSRDLLRKLKHRKTVRVAGRDSKSAKTMRGKSSSPASVPSNSKDRSNSKQTKVIGMLRMPAGATIESMMSVTGWQQHSVRGFLAGVVRKKLGLDLASETTENGRVYRIDDRKTSSPADAKTGKAA